MEDDDSIFNLVDSEADHPVADRSVADRSVADRPVTDRPVSDRFVTDHSSLIERSYSGYLDYSVADRSMADRSHANRLIDHFEPDRSSADNRYNNISGNMSCYIRILETYIIFDIYKLLLLLLSQGKNYRGNRAGLYKQQERFMRFLYQLSSAHSNWGRRDRRRYEDKRSNDEKK